MRTRWGNNELMSHEVYKFKYGHGIFAAATEICEPCGSFLRVWRQGPNGNHTALEDEWRNRRKPETMGYDEQ